MSDVFNQKINESKLRDCQIEAYAALKSHFSSSSANKHVLIQLPTGTGKSALISIIPFQLAKKKVLIITPNLTLSEQLKDDLDIINNPNKNVYEKFEIFPAATLAELELHVLKLDSNGNYSDIDNYQIIVSNYHQFGDIEKWFKDRKDIFDLIIIDEAHHQNAKTYQEIIAFFSDCKIISLTATPFRSDNSKVEGEKIYSFSFKRAIQSKYIRNIKAQSISPDQIELSFLDQNNTKYSLNEIMKMKENAWFRKGIAFSQDCCDSIASLAKSKLISLRTNFPNEFHQIIAVAMSIRHAREFVKLAFEKLNLRVGIVSSEDKSTNTEVLKKLKKEKIDVIIHVGMIGEGFDHNRLGVAAIFRPFASLNPYIQFIGRVIRNNGSTKYSYVVSHLGLNQIKRFEEFKLFDSDDEEFLQELLKVSGTNTQTIGSEDSFINESNENEEKETKSQIARINETGDKTVNVESQFFNDDKVTSVKEAIDSLS
ncbi:MAG: DEAD/DEAH box helicase, partial [Candidatus Melainabacteria bacterium]